MYLILMVVHILVCLVLIAVILLQAGKGSGLAEVFGSETAQSILGTQASSLLKRATTVSAVLFLLTSLSLGVITAIKGRSLFDYTSLPTLPISAKQESAPSEAAQAPEAATTAAAPTAETTEAAVTQAVPAAPIAEAETTASAE